MRALIVILLMAASVHAQSIAEAARKERERREHLKPAPVVKAEGSVAAPDTKPPEGTASAEKPKEAPKAPAAPSVDPVKEYNDQVQKLRTKMQSLQDDETAAQLRINELNNQIYAPVVDQATKDSAMGALTEARDKLAVTRLQLDETRKTLEALQLQGPPKTAATPGK